MKELINSLQKYDKIILTGAQRSGTTIGMEILAHELGYDAIREEQIEIDDISFLAGLLVSRTKFVLQCPGSCSYVHLIKGKDTAIVFMKRNIPHVIASERRIEWNVHEPYELAKYFRSKGTISMVKRQNWELYQKPMIKERAFELEYESLVHHPLFIQNRTNFGIRQTAV